MNPKVKKMFVKALRSGKYRQTYNILHLENSFCVLGVLCNLYIKKHKDAQWRNQVGVTEYFISMNRDFSFSFPPKEILDWSGLEEGDANLLIELNDEDEKTFSWLANFIEKKL